MIKSTQDMTTLEIMISAMSLCKYSRPAVYTDNLNILFECVCLDLLKRNVYIVLFTRKQTVNIIRPSQMLRESVQCFANRNRSSMSFLKWAMLLYNVCKALFFSTI